jgi:hypothetical protein
MMGCDVPVRECLFDHYKPKLAPASITRDGLQIRARCPACDHDNHSLVVSAGQFHRIVWECHNTGCDGRQVRRALLTAGIPARCLPRGDGTERSPEQQLADEIGAILTDKTTDATARLRALALVRGYRRWPGGKELVALAAEAGLKRAAAFNIAAGPLGPRTFSTTRPEQKAVKNPQVSSAILPDQAVHPGGQVHGGGLPEVHAGGLPEKNRPEWLSLPEQARKEEER